MVPNGLGNVGFEFNPNGSIHVTHKPVGDTNAMIGFAASHPTPTLKMTSAVCAWATAAAEMGYLSNADGFYGRATGVVSKAASMTSAPIALAGALKLSGEVVTLATDPSCANVSRVVVTATKTAAKTCETAGGFCGAMGGEYAELSGKLGMTKHGLNIPLDVKDLYSTYSARQDLQDSTKPRAVPNRADFTEAEYSANSAQGAKQMCALAYHTLCFATGFFALVVSPLWGLIVGGVFLVATIASVVFDTRVDDMRQGDAFARLQTFEGHFIQPQQV